MIVFQVSEDKQEQSLQNWDGAQQGEEGWQYYLEKFGSLIIATSQVGWYPMGVCTRRVNSEGSFFTFCVGQPNDTLRDGLIRCKDLSLLCVSFLHQLFQVSHLFPG